MCDVGESSTECNNISSERERGNMLFRSESQSHPVVFHKSPVSRACILQGRFFKLVFGVYSTHASEKPTFGADNVTAWREVMVTSAAPRTCCSGQDWYALNTLTSSVVMSVHQPQIIKNL